MKPVTSPGDMVEETLVTEISIGPDGRVWIFGLSREVLEVMTDLEPNNHALKQRLSAVRQAMQPAIDAASTSEHRDA